MISARDAWPIYVQFTCDRNVSSIVDPITDIVIVYVGGTRAQEIKEKMTQKQWNIITVTTHITILVCSRNMIIEINDAELTIFARAGCDLFPIRFIIDLRTSTICGDCNLDINHCASLTKVTGVIFDIISATNDMEIFYIGPNFNGQYEAYNYQYVQFCYIDSQWKFQEGERVIPANICAPIFDKYRDDLVRQLHTQYRDDIMVASTKLVLFCIIMREQFCRDIIVYIAGYLRALIPRPLIE